MILNRKTGFEKTEFIPKQPPEIFYKKVFLKHFAKFTRKHLCQSLLAQVFSCEFCEICKNTFCYRTPPDDCFSLFRLHFLKNVTSTLPFRENSKSSHLVLFKTCTGESFLSLRISPGFYLNFAYILWYPCRL